MQLAKLQKCSCKTQPILYKHFLIIKTANKTSLEQSNCQLQSLSIVSNKTSLEQSNCQLQSLSIVSNKTSLEQSNCQLQSLSIVSNKYFA